MLETEDIDDDYFTPASSTSLASIFGKPRKDDGTENESLKYTPPKPLKPEDSKPTQCIFACALLGFEWSNGTYMSKGKLGFAVVKIIKTGIHNIILYDSNKVTLSCATITSKFEVTVKENVYLSYHDNQQKYWSLNAPEQETNKILDFLISLNVIVKHSSDEDKERGPPEKSSTDNITPNAEKEVKDDKESDTDSSVNRRTKISILNRMASMGQSVLPPRTISTEKTSDSSDTNDTGHYKSVRHKPIKSSMKRNSSDKNLPECQSLVETEKLGNAIVEHSTSSIANTVPVFTYLNGQLVPVTNTNIITSPINTMGNDMNHFISEQRVSNSELRINVNRMTDKVDQVLSKLSNLEHKEENDFQTNILQKLLAEYENKIKMYESFITAQGLDNNFGTQLYGISSKDSLKPTECDSRDKIQKLEELGKEKDNKIENLERDVKLLQDKLEDAISTEKKNREELQNEVEHLKRNLDSKQKELIVSDQKFQELLIKEEDQNMGAKIKNIMNDTFHAISSNFESHEEYSGERVKAVTAAVIKKVTIESLSNL